MDISEFVVKHRKQIKDISILKKKEEKLPWYKRPIERTAFISRKAKDGKHYVRHKEWADNIWIGPYSSIEEVDDVINSYVEKSLEAPLNKIYSGREIHSVYVNDVRTFF